MYVGTTMSLVPADDFRVQASSFKLYTAAVFSDDEMTAAQAGSRTWHQRVALAETKSKYKRKFPTRPDLCYCASNGDLEPTKDLRSCQGSCGSSTLRSTIRLF